MSHVPYYHTIRTVNEGSEKVNYGIIEVESLIIFHLKQKNFFKQLESNSNY